MATRTPPASLTPVDHWHTEHAYFKRLLGLLHREVAVFECGQRPDYGLMQDVIGYLREYSDRVHHPREDVAFARLERHCPELGPVFARLRQEHRVIANAGERLHAQLEAVLEDSLLPRAEIEASAATYLVYYHSHIEREEHDVLPRAARALTAEDWAAVEAAVPSSPDPLFGTRTAERYRQLRHRMAVESV